ncbi:succinic semialdehyde dehydrogenase [Actinokineospora sp. HUAS TT18]|uniref:succinic semialdehyde dehydrogenase n=1 Tax=Actinokineospora sp. HUAS TT18 TaxID=3447451 RepID=UPI003F5286CF
MTLPASITPELIARLSRHVAASTDATVSTVEVFTGATLATLPCSTEQDVADAVAAARGPQAAWAAVDPQERMAVFARFHKLVLDNRDTIADLIQAETGKARRYAFEDLIEPAITTAHYLKAAPRLLRPRKRKGMMPFAIQTTELRVPKGVVGIISPWNFPFALGISDSIPALMAGNAVVLKPDTQTALSPLFGVDLLYRAGLPDGLITVVIGDGPTVGGALVDSADYVGFTGSTRTGAEVGAKATGRLIGCSLELGGKNPMVVLDDADLDVAVAGAVTSAFANTGQLCMHIERVYAHESVYDAFVRKFVEKTGKLKLGAGYDYKNDVGSLISTRQRKAVAEHVDDARAKGATVHIGGAARDDLGPAFYEPTVLTGVTPDMLCHAQETFGPVVAIYPVRDDDEAVALANDTAYGLNASVYGRDLARAKAVGARLRAGTVNINDGHAAAYASIDAPMGGMGRSGLGRRHGVEGLLKYTESQNLSVQRIQVIPPPKGIPYGRYTSIMARSLRLLRKLGVR